MGKVLGLLFAVGTMTTAGCAHAPKTAAERSVLRSDAQNTVATMTAQDPSLRPLMDRAAGYVVFPKVTEGGLVAGGAGGRGVVYENGQPVGFAELSAASLGAEAGAQQYAELIVVRDPDTLARLKTGKFDFGAEASAVALHSGAASESEFGERGVSVFVQPERGAMFNLSLTGQRIRFTG
jgi:lipid-binding SYLF domain-containing protein